MGKIAWKYGENETQKYYDAYVGKHYLCVFANKWSPDIWLGVYDVNDGRLYSIWDKTFNDRQRKRQGLPKNCDMEALSVCRMLSSRSPEYMMKKVEHCYKRRKVEVCK